jgi:hypothetical protein
MATATRAALAALFVLMAACGDEATGGGAGTGGPGGPGDPGGDPGTNPPGPTTNPPAPSSSVTVHLVPEAGVTGKQRVSFAVPLGRGWLKSEADVTVKQGATELGAARRQIGKFADGSIRSVQIQFDLDVRGETDVEVQLGAKPTAPQPQGVAVEQTLMDKSGTQVPRVWAVLPAKWLSASQVTGPSRPEAETPAAVQQGFTKACNYTRHSADSFTSLQSDSSVWLYDRPTAMYRGYARRGDLTTLSSAYREIGLYRAGLRGTGVSTTIGLTDKATDLKYYYAQGFALHYLFTGDDRFREAAENITERIAAMWTQPEYNSNVNFWTERHAGFALLAYVWSQIVSDDRAARYASLADAAVRAYVKTQDAATPGYTDANARCFAHSADAHGEPYGYLGCSPWMSAIVGDGLETFMRERTGVDDALAGAAKTSLVKLGRAIATRGRDSNGKPYYWMGIGATARGEVDPDNEHWGESAYLVAMAWHYGGKTDAALKPAATQLFAGLAANGTAPHMRSFNWQCRSAPMAAAFYE